MIQVHHIAPHPVIQVFFVIIQVNSPSNRIGNIVNIGIIKTNTKSNVLSVPITAVAARVKGSDESLDEKKKENKKKIKQYKMHK